MTSIYSYYVFYESVCSIVVYANWMETSKRIPTIIIPKKNRGKSIGSNPFI